MMKEVKTSKGGPLLPAEHSVLSKRTDSVQLKPGHYLNYSQFGSGWLKLSLELSKKWWLVFFLLAYLISGCWI